MIPQISIIDIIRFQRESFSIRTDNKSCYVLTCRIKGESSFFYNHKEQLVKRGDVLYIPVGNSYSQTCESETVICFHLNISGKVSSSMQLFCVKDADKMCELFVRAEQLWKEKPTNYEFMCMSILYDIMSQIQIRADRETDRVTALLQPAIEYLDANLFNADMTLEKACQIAHISRTYFNKLFYQTCDASPITYINRQRIERAKQLLLSGNYCNEEIAHLCGFKDVKYFYVVFKKVTGKTTKEFKKRS